MEKAKVLIVEDEAIIAMEVESQLQGLGYEVTSIVDTGEEAIKKAEEDKPDIILMDIRIKGEMDGIDTATVIRSRFGIPVIFSTAYLDQERIERAKITMPFGYVLKPMQERDLKVTIEMALYVAKVDAERREVEKELQRSEALLNDAQQMAKIGSWEIDLERQVTYWTDELYRIHDLHPDRFTSLEITAADNTEHLNPLEFTAVDEAIKLSEKCYSPEDQQKLMDAFKKCQEEAQPYEFELPFTTVKGHQKWIKATTMPIKKGNNVVKIRGYLEDITERKHKEDKLKESERRFHDLLLSSTDWIWETDNSGKYTFVSEKVENILGYSPNEIIGKTPFDLMPKEEAVCVGEIFKNILSVKKPIKELENWNLTKGGDKVCLLTNGMPILDNEGNLLGYRGIDKDITDFKKTGKVT